MASCAEDKGCIKGGQSTTVEDNIVMTGNLLCLCVYERWTDADEDKERLVAMQTTDIDIRNTQYGCEVALRKIEMEAATDQFSSKERDTMPQIWDTIDTEEEHHWKGNNH